MVVSGRFVFGIFAFCLLWIWLFSGNSQNKRSINVKSNTYEITNSLSNYLVSNLPVNDSNRWYSYAKSAENFAGTSFEVIPATKNNEIIVGLFSKDKINEGFIFKIKWENNTVFVSSKVSANGSTSEYIVSRIPYTAKFTVEFKLVSFYLREEICSNYKCDGSFEQYQFFKLFNSTIQLKFDTFFISIPTKNSALIRNFKIQKFLKNPNAVKYFPLLSTNGWWYTKIPMVNSLEYIFYLQNFKENQTKTIQSHLYPGKEKSSDELTITWRQWPLYININYCLIKNILKSCTILNMPYSEVITVHLYFDFNKNLSIIETDNKNVTVNKFNEKIQFISADSEVSISVNPDNGILSGSTDEYHAPNNNSANFTEEIRKTAYMIEFNNISSSLTATIASSIKGYDINVFQYNSTTIITLNNKKFTLIHDSSNPKPQIKIFLEKDIINIFTNDGKSGYFECGIMPDRFVNFTVTERDGVFVIVKRAFLTD